MQKPYTKTVAQTISGAINESDKIQKEIATELGYPHSSP